MTVMYIYIFVWKAIQYSGFGKSEPWALSEVGEGKGAIHGRARGGMMWTVSPIFLGRGQGAVRVLCGRY